LKDKSNARTKGGNMNQKTKTVKSGFSAHLFAVKLMEKLVEFFKKVLTTGLLEFCTKWLSLIGHIAIIVAAGLGFIFSLVYAIKDNNFFAFLIGLAWVVGLFVIQYTAHKFLTAGGGLIKNNPTKLASRAFFDCVGFIVLIGGVVVLVLHTIALIQGAPFTYFLQGLGMFVFLELVALVAFNFGEANMEIVEDNSAGQEAIGIITFFIKTIMRLIPILFGALVALGTVMLFIEGLRLFGDAYKFAWIVIKNGVAPQIVDAALLPFLSYIFFALAYLVIDIIRAILSIPEQK
jgi:hypothetical protein